MRCCLLIDMSVFDITYDSAEIICARKLYLFTYHASNSFGILPISQYFQTGENLGDNVWSDALYAAYAMTVHETYQVTTYQISVSISHRYTLNNED